MPPPLETATDSRGTAGAAAPWLPATGAVAGWLSGELADVYRNYWPRLQRATVLMGRPATDEIRQRCDERVWRYLVWLDRQHGVGDPLGGTDGHRRAVLACYARQLRNVEDLDDAGVEVELEIVQDMHRRVRHGGNRLDRGHPFLEWTPSYERVRKLRPDSERRDRNQRRRIELAADEALRAGELSRQERTALGVLLGHTNDRCTTEIVVSLATVGREAGGYAARTAGEWLRALHAKGWLHKVHRLRHVLDEATGVARLEATSNLWRPVIPERFRRGRHEAEDRARARKKAERAKPGRYTPPKGSAAGGAKPGPPGGRGGAGPRPPVVPSEEETRRRLQEQRQQQPVVEARSVGIEDARRALREAQGRAPP